MAIDERRRVAARLRMSDERDAAGFVDCLLAEVVRGREFCETPCEECHARLLGELADLIDPGESGQNLDRNQDTVQKESPAVQIAPECDRDALLEEVKELKKCAYYFGLDFDEDEPLRDRLKEASEAFAESARRVREALGVDDG